MPPKTAKARPNLGEIAALRAWVQAGAGDDGANIKVAIPDIKPRGRAAAPVTSVALDPSGPWLAIGKQKLLEIVDLKSGVVTDQPQSGNITAPRL